MGLHETELSTVGITDPAEITRIRDQRFLLRQARIMADPNLDDRLKVWMLDRQIWDTERAADEFGWGKSNVWDLRRVTDEFGPNHASAYPDLDNEPGTAESGVEAGRLREWAERRGSHIIDPETGKLSKRPAMRHGRTRADRGNLNKASHKLGTPRKGKKGTAPGPRRRYSEEDVARIRTLAGQFLNDEQIAQRLGEPFTAKIVERLRQTNEIPAGSVQRRQQRDAQK